MLDEGIPVVELDASFKPDNDDGCDCGCEDNVVEFGDYSDDANNIADDDNVVEF